MELHLKGITKIPKVLCKYKSHHSTTLKDLQWWVDNLTLRI